MIHRALIATVVAASALSLAESSRADCMPGNAFTSAARSARVLVVRAGGTRLRPPYAANLSVERALFGPAAPRTMSVQFNPLSGASFTNGQRYIVFVSARGDVEGGCSTVSLAQPDAGAVVDALRDWLAAQTDRARVAVLVRTIAATPSKAASDAASFLAASPALLAAMDASDRARLIAAIPAAHDERAYGIAWTLARLHAIESLPAWIAWLSVSHNGANPRPVHDALELMTNHHDSAYTRGRDLTGDLQRQLVRNWSQWESAHRGQSPAQFITSGFRERGITVGSLTDRAQLATALRGIASTSSDEVSRQTLANACEMSVRPTQSVMPHTFSAVDVQRALAVCTAP